MNLHTFTEGCLEIDRMLAFRDWLRTHEDERGLYERLCLEGFQAGLAWITILRKREAFCAGFGELELT